MSLFGIAKGRLSFSDLYSWAQYKSEDLVFRKVMDKDIINIPSPSTFHRILSSIDKDELEKVFRKYFKKFTNMLNLALDGKWLNGSGINGQLIIEDKKIIFNILDKERRIVIGHKFIGNDKKSEVAVFDELLKDKEFSADGQTFSFDALSTRARILGAINGDKNQYLAYVKGNEKNLLKKVKETIEEIGEATEIFENKESDFSIENNNKVQRKVEIFQSKSCDIIIYDPQFKNIQTLLKITKTTIDNITNNKTITVKYMIANFKTSAINFHNEILKHWRVETYHFFLDTMMGEDDHNAYKNPFGMSILRSFILNLYQLFFNDHEGEKIIVNGVMQKKKITMAEIQRHSRESDSFVSDLFEQ